MDRTERVTQMCAVLLAISTILIGWICLVLCIYILLFTNYYCVAFLYLAYLVYDRKACDRSGRRIDCVKNWSFWKHAADYFPVSIIKTVELDPQKNYICGYHPHGYFALGAFTKFVLGWRDTKNLFPGMTCNLLGASQLFWLPMGHEIFMAIDIRTVSKESISWLLTKEGKGKMLILPIGGATEAIDAHPGMARLTLKTRRGFVRMAIKHKASLVPMFAFGENEAIRQYKTKQGSILRWIQGLFKSITGLTFLIPLSIVPLKLPIDIVGKPIDVVSNPNPDDEQVNFYHKLYVDNLIDLFNRNKINYDNYKNVTMEIV